MLADGKVSEQDLDMIRLTDDVDEAIKLMIDAQQRRRSAAPGGGESPDAPHRPD
jgi:hypothetical protein